MTQATFDFGQLDWRFNKAGKNWGCWEASHGVWKCSINAAERRAFVLLSAILRGL